MRRAISLMAIGVVVFALSFSCGSAPPKKAPREGDTIAIGTLSASASNSIQELFGSDSLETNE